MRLGVSLLIGPDIKQWGTGYSWPKLIFSYVIEHSDLFGLRTGLSAEMPGFIPSVLALQTSRLVPQYSVWPLIAYSQDPCVAKKAMEPMNYHCCPAAVVIMV